MKAVDRRAHRIVERMAAGVDASRREAAARGHDEFGNPLPPSGRVPSPEELRASPNHPYNRARARAYSEDDND